MAAEPTSAGDSRGRPGPLGSLARIRLLGPSAEAAAGSLGGASAASPPSLSACALCCRSTQSPGARVSA